MGRDGPTLHHWPLLWPDPIRQSRMSRLKRRRKQLLNRLRDAGGRQQGLEIEIRLVEQTLAARRQENGR